MLGIYYFPVVTEAELLILSGGIYGLITSMEFDPFSENLFNQMKNDSLVMSKNQIYRILICRRLTTR